MSAFRIFSSSQLMSLCEGSSHGRSQHDVPITNDVGGDLERPEQESEFESLLSPDANPRLFPF